VSNTDASPAMDPTVASAPRDLDAASIDAGPYRTAANVTARDPLGALVRHFGPLSSKEVIERFLAEWGGYLVLAVIGFALTAWWNKDEYFGLMAILTGIIVAIGAFRLVFRGSDSATVFEHGLRYHQGRRYQDVRWDEVSAVRVDLVRTRYVGGGGGETIKHHFHIETIGGRSILLTHNITKVLELGELVQRKTMPIIGKRLLDELAAGNPVAFAPESKIMPMGILYLGRLTEWSKISAIEVVKGKIVVKPAGVWPFSSVTNAHAVVTLMRILVEKIGKRG